MGNLQTMATRETSAPARRFFFGSRRCGTDLRQERSSEDCGGRQGQQGGRRRLHRGLETGDVWRCGSTESNRLERWSMGFPWVFWSFWDLRFLHMCSKKSSWCMINMINDGYIGLFRGIMGSIVPWSSDVAGGGMVHASPDAGSVSEKDSDT